MEGVWQQTRSPDASSSEMFIHSHERTHTYTHTHQYSFVSVVQSSEPSLLPAVRLSQNLLCTSVVGILEPPRFPVIPLGQRQASRTEAGPLSQMPTHREGGWDGRYKGDSGFVQRTVHRGLPPSLTSLCLYVLPRVGACQLISRVFSGARADSWPGNPFQESQVDFCVKQRSIIGRPD